MITYFVKLKMKLNTYITDNSVKIENINWSSGKRVLYIEEIDVGISITKKELSQIRSFQNIFTVS